jgi:uncharacterized protein (TIGR00730 family)
MNKKVIAVYGSSSITQDSVTAKAAEKMGKRLVEAGYSISNGGYMGVMEAASRGAKEANGEVIGVTCRSFSKRSPNPYLTKEIDTADLPERISTLMNISDGYIVLDGGIGTLAELLLAWNLLVLGGSKPVIVVGESLRKSVYAMAEHTEVSDDLINMLIFAETVEEACDKLTAVLPA